MLTEQHGLFRSPNHLLGKSRAPPTRLATRLAAPD